MNTEVKATGFQVIAKTDDTYLLISNTNNTATAIQGENQGKGNILLAMTMEEESSKVFASAPVQSDAEVAYLTAGTEQNGHKTVEGDLITTPGAVISGYDSALVTNWYTAKAVDASASTIDATTARQLTTDEFAKYVIKKTVYLTVAKGANDAYHLTVTGKFTQNKDAQEVDGADLTACKVLIVTSNSDLEDNGTHKGGFAILSSANPTKTIYFNDTDVITDETVVTVDMYIFYDGNDANVYTNNVAKLTGAKFDLSFAVTAVPQN